MEKTDKEQGSDSTSREYIYIDNERESDVAGSDGTSDGGMPEAFSDALNPQET